MALPEVSVSGRGMKITPAIKKYIDEKIGKYWDIYISVVTRIEVVCVQNKSARGVNQDFKVDITVYLPRVTARVEKEGADIYGLIDLATNVLIRKVKKYKDEYKKWEGKEVKNGGQKKDKDDDQLMSYIPKISKITKVEDSKPMLPEEAAEKMELNDYETFMFRDSKSGFPSMVYRRKDGTYGMVQLCSIK
ncbi:MAG: ribosome-associated translation inhibitor RaiA [bacterium]